MSKIVWDDIGARLAETGVKNGVLYPMAAGAYTAGVAWNGLTSVNEAPTGAEASPFYADNQKYLEIMSEEEFAGTIGCYTYPDEFKPCIGETSLHAGVSIGQQRHIAAGLCYRTEIVNDTDGLDHGFKIHLVYNSLFGVSARDHTTVNESPELEELSFDFTATKVPVTGAKPTAHLIIDSTKIPVEDAAKFQTLLDTLYGKDAIPEVPAVIGTGTELEPEIPAIPAVPAVIPTLLLPDAIAAIFAAA
jgi:hypothetical protein